MPITHKRNGQISRTNETFIEPTHSSYCVDLLRTFLGMEVWKQVRDFSDFNVSNFGNVQHFRDGIVRKKYLRDGGYYQVSLGGENVDIHRIVCKTFIPECDYIGKKLSVDHINRVRTCNILTNLRWETRQGQRENQSYPETHSKTRPIWRCKLDGTKIDRYTGSTDAAKKLFDKISHNNTTVDSMASRISEACRGVKNNLFGYKWCFDEEVNASLPGEVWKDIPVCILGDPKYKYEASTKGRIRTKRSKLIMNGYRVEGYNRYSIAQNGDRITLTMRGNQIIATTFIPNPDNLPVADHKNEIRHDDRVENLRWASYQQNAEYHHQINDSAWSGDHEQLLMDACKKAMVGDNIVWEQFIVPDEIGHRTFIAIKGRYHEIRKRDSTHNRDRNHWTEEEKQILKESLEKVLVQEVSWNEFTKPCILEHRTLEAIQSRYRKHLHNEILRYPGRCKTSWTREQDQALMEACKKAYVQYVNWDKFQIPDKLKHRSKHAIKGRWKNIRRSLIDNPRKHNYRKSLSAV